MKNHSAPSTLPIINTTHQLLAPLQRHVRLLLVSPQLPPPLTTNGRCWIKIVCTGTQFAQRRNNT